MTSTRTRLSWAAVGMVVSYNLFCWLPASIWAFTIVASTGLVFLFAARPGRFGTIVAILSFAAGMLTSRFLPDGYDYYFAGFSLILVFLPAGLMAAGIRRRFSAYQTQVLAVIPALVLMLLYLANVGDAATAWKQILSNMNTMIIDWYREAFKALPSSFSPEEMNRLKESMESMFDLFYRFFPALVICWAAAMNIAAYYFAGMMIRKDGGFYRELRAFAQWKAGTINMVLLAVTLLLWLTGIESIKALTENMLFLLAVSYMVVGLALIEYYLGKKRIHPVLRIVFYLGLLLSGWIGGLLASGIGLVDSHFDFRRVRARQIG